MRCIKRKASDSVASGFNTTIILLLLEFFHKKQRPALAGLWLTYNVIFTRNRKQTRNWTSATTTMTDELSDYPSLISLTFETPLFVIHDTAAYRSS
jgi:hypothetical protein